MTWVEVCSYDGLIPDRGVAALVGGAQVAVFRLRDGSVHAISNFDPFSGAFVLSRGLVGTRQGSDTVASPMFKQRFDLRTGTCLDDPAVRLPTWDVRVDRGVVQVGQPTVCPLP